MKKFLLILFFYLFSNVSYAQIVGGIYYEPLFSDPNSQPYRPQSQQRAIRTTAYSFDSYSNTYVKHPIKVIEYYEYGMVKYKVTEEYKSHGYGGQWVKVYAPVSKCMSAYSDLNALEGQFTHKANMMGTIYYFDL